MTALGSRWRYFKMAASDHVMRTTAEEGDFANADPRIAQALFGSGGDQAKKQLRANSYQRVKQTYGNQMAETQKRAFQELDKAFVRGFRTSGLRSNSMSANAQQLDYDEWEDRDDQVVPETQEALTAIDDLINAGLTHDTSPARLISVYQKANEFDSDDVERSMDARARSVGDSTVKTRAGVPLLFSHFDYEISMREIQNSENFGEDLPTEDARKAGRALREDMELQMFKGWNGEIAANGGLWSIGGYTTAPSTLTGDATGEFGDPDNGASNVLDTIDAMLAKLEKQGPNQNEGYMAQEFGAWLYYPTAQHGEIYRQADPRGDGNMSLARRIGQDYPYVELRHAGVLDPGELVMVIQSPDVVDIANGQAPTNMSWELENGLVTRYKTLGMQIPRIKSTQSGRSGIVHFTGA